jgi:hypothetical protein
MSKTSKLVLISLTLLCIAGFSNNRTFKKLTVHVNHNDHNVQHLNNSALEESTKALESFSANFEEMCIAIEKATKRKHANNGMTIISGPDQERITVNGISFPASAEVRTFKIRKKYCDPRWG